MTRRISLVSVVVLAIALFAAPRRLAAQLKIGVVSFQQALLDTAEVKKEAGRLETKYKPKQDEIASLTKELQDIQQKLQSAPADQAAQLQADGTRKQRDLQRLQEDMQSDFDFDRNTILQASSQKMRDVIKTLAEAKGLDLVTEADNNYYFKPTMDLTAEATAAYDKAHPVQ